jgi:hypothetical protein
LVKPAAIVGTAVLVALLVVVINRYGQRLARHDWLLSQVNLRLDNLHKEKKDAYVRSMQVQPIPPPLSEARTTEIDEALLLTLKLDPRNRKGGPE